jgi:hypothetical protein
MFKYELKEENGNGVKKFDRKLDVLGKWKWQKIEEIKDESKS